MRAGKRSWSWIVLASTAVVGAVAASAASGSREAEESKRSICCVANPRFAGICGVELGPEETCADVLAYLNDAASVGKTYCGSTSIRMGWQQVECQDE